MNASHPDARVAVPTTQAYARSIPREARTDTSGCYVHKCLACGGMPVGCAYHCGGESLWLGFSTYPFMCCSLPLGFTDPYYLSFKQDMTVVVVDEEKKTLACYGGVGNTCDQCCVCYKL